MEGTSRTFPYTIKFVGLLGSHSLGRNPKFMATAVDLGRELVRRKIRLTYGGGNVGLQGAVASTVYTNGGIVRGFIPGYIAARQVYGPTYGAEYTVSSNYYKHFEMNHVVEAYIVLPGGIDTMEGLFTLISWACEGLYSKPIGLLNIDGYFNNLIKFLDDAVRQNFMASSQRKLFISSFFIDELLDKLAFAKAFPGPGASYDEFKRNRISIQTCSGGKARIVQTHVLGFHHVHTAVGRIPCAYYSGPVQSTRDILVVPGSLPFGDDDRSAGVILSSGTNPEVDMTERVPTLESSDDGEMGGARMLGVS
ncbi:hypothetical protein DM860_017610 [Cuscuta australis]|uniref:cytokinin riboside 5'-monophosphate phosphoribohydrolase n=1 Tax=Cuscuta australis TaxID=267555 RepID=A0A328EEE5_9ASTE|nr:hypothetical protein DM860_017610 [Cuscuta australis]